VAEGEELAKALDTALPMLAVAGAEESALEGFISAVSVRLIVRLKSCQSRGLFVDVSRRKVKGSRSSQSGIFTVCSISTKGLCEVRRRCLINVLGARIRWPGSEVFHDE
jgi:hypothetical protein